MKTCPDCGCRVYSLGCVNCNEMAYIEQQAASDGYDDTPIVPKSLCPICYSEPCECAPEASR